MPKKFLHAHHPRIKLFKVHGIIKRIHALLVAHRAKLAAHIAPYALRGAAGIGVFRVRLFQLF